MSQHESLTLYLKEETTNVEFHGCICLWQQRKNEIWLLNHHFELFSIHEVKKLGCLAWKKLKSKLKLVLVLVLID